MQNQKGLLKSMNLQLIMIGTGLIGLNLSLMSFIWFYFLNQDFHNLMTGKPF